MKRICLRLKAFTAQIITRLRVSDESFSGAVACSEPWFCTWSIIRQSSAWVGCCSQCEADFLWAECCFLHFIVTQPTCDSLCTVNNNSFDLLRRVKYILIKSFLAFTSCRLCLIEISYGVTRRMHAWSSGLPLGLSSSKFAVDNEELVSPSSPSEAVRGPPRWGHGGVTHGGGRGGHMDRLQLWFHAAPLPHRNPRAPAGHQHRHTCPQYTSR